MGWKEDTGNIVMWHIQNYKSILFGTEFATLGHGHLSLQCL